MYTCHSQSRFFGSSDMRMFVRFRAWFHWKQFVLRYGWQVRHACRVQYRLPQHDQVRYWPGFGASNEATWCRWDIPAPGNGVTKVRYRCSTAQVKKCRYTRCSKHLITIRRVFEFWQCKFQHDFLLFFLLSL
jgi:hypothetical protein